MVTTAVPSVEQKSLDKTQETLSKYRAISDELSQINQEQIRQESLQKVIDQLNKSPVSDYQRANTIANIAQHLQSPKFKLSTKEQQTLEKIRSSVNIAVNTSSNIDELSFSIHNQLQTDKTISLPSKDEFQVSLNSQLTSIPSLEKYQQIHKQLKQQITTLDPQLAVSEILKKQGVDEADNVASAIVNQSFNQLIVPPNKPNRVNPETIIVRSLPNIDSQTKSDLVTILQVEQELLTTSPSFYTTKQQLSDAGITQQQLPNFYTATQLTPLDLRTHILASPSSSNTSVASENPSYQLPSIDNYIQIYRLAAPYKPPSVSFWQSPSQYVQTWINNINSSSQVGSKNFLQNIFSGSSGQQGGIPFNPNLPGLFKNISFGQKGGGLRSLLGGLGKLGRFFGLGGGGTVAAGGASAAAVATSEIWIPALIIGLIILIIVLIIMLPGANTIVSSNLAPVNGRGGGSGGLAFICKPDDPGCPKSLCSDCQSPVTCGIVTQCPGGNYSHSSTNAIDFGVGGCSAANLGVYSQFEGTVIVVVMDYLDGSGYEGSSEGYANHVDIQFTDPDTGRSFILRYAHLSQQSIVAVGDSVSPGQLIGYADHTGNSSGPHLHYELLATDGGAVPSITTIVPNSGCE